jgi:hypothetical protein
MYLKIATINSSSIAQTLARKIVCPEFIGCGVFLIHVIQFCSTLYTHHLHVLLDTNVYTFLNLYAHFIE